MIHEVRWFLGRLKLTYLVLIIVDPNHNTSIKINYSQDSSTHYFRWEVLDNSIAATG